MKNCNCDNKKPVSGDSWIRNHWRPAMAIQYMFVCIVDFVIFPMMWSGIQIHSKLAMTQWEPLTLKSTGMYHMAMGAVLGVAAWTRGQENIEIAKQPEGKYTEPDTPK